MINPLSDVITCNTSEHFTHFSSFFPGPYGAWKNTTQLAKYLIAFYFKPSNEVYSLFPIKQLQMKGNVSGLNEIAEESVVKVLHHYK